MEAPDKIYINPEYDLYRTQKNPPFEETYIRKDYLLEWLKDMKFMAKSERVGAYQNVIDKLNKM